MTQQLKAQLDAIHTRLRFQGFDVRQFVFDATATDAEIRQLEISLGLVLPSSLKDAFRLVSRRIEFRWFAPKDFTFPTPFHSNFCGDLRWSVDSLKSIDEEKASWVSEVFNNPENEYDRVWQHKLAFQDVGNGDYLAVDLAPDTVGRVIYLSHDDGEGHGRVMADSLQDLLDRWVPLACTGAEDWQWLPFSSPTDGRIDPTSGNGKAWRELLRIDG